MATVYTIKDLVAWAESQDSYGGIPKSDVVRKAKELLVSQVDNGSSPVYINELVEELKSRISHMLNFYENMKANGGNKDVSNGYILCLKDFSFVLEKYIDKKDI